jgi:hypothetical protein
LFAAAFVNKSLLLYIAYKTFTLKFEEVEQIFIK